MSEEREMPLAVALSYARDDAGAAPRVSARGSGDQAERMIALAREAGIPLQENPVLLAALASVGVGEEIPEALYLTVAQVLAFAYWLDDRQPGGG